jgi:AraC-like DNA-binding protein
MASAAVAPWTNWRSVNYPVCQQYDAWYAALNESHLKWMLRKPAETRFNGEIDMRMIGDVRLLHCRCDSCQGMRTKREIARSGGEYFGILLLYGGTETVSFSDRTANLDKSGLLIWDSADPLEFTTSPGLKKVTMLVPRPMLKQRVSNVEDSVGRSISMNHGLGAVTASHIMALGQQTNRIEKRSAASLVDLTLELVATCLEAQSERPMTQSRNELLQDVKRFIENNLDDPKLSPPVIAKQCNISIRYLHLLFHDSGSSVSGWILNRRLEQCRRELVHTGQLRKSITDIAYRWGFNDSAHFCRAFKRLYGVSPREYRKSLFE